MPPGLNSDAFNVRQMFFFLLTNVYSIYCYSNFSCLYDKTKLASLDMEPENCATILVPARDEETSFNESWTKAIEVNLNNDCWRKRKKSN